MKDIRKLRITKNKLGLYSVRYGRKKLSYDTSKRLATKIYKGIVRIWKKQKIRKRRR